MKYPRYTRRRTYTKREFDTLFDAYQTLGALLLPLGDARIEVLDNLADMLDGRRPRWDGKALRKARAKNHRAMEKAKGAGHESVSSLAGCE